jgi:multiple sugar transport system ATP-binding protein
MLRMIAGLESITQGTLYIGDRVVNDVPPKDRDIAMVFQNYALYPHMSVYDNMAFGLKLRKYPKDEIRSRVQQAAEILGIEPILQRKPKALSGGQRQRVAVGRAIVRKPRVFLFDEPLSNLDAKLRVQMRTEISKLHRQLAATMIYVTHDQVEAMTMGDRIVVLRDGYIQQIDRPLNLYNNPRNRFVAGFIGSPSMNFVEGKIIRDGGLLFRAMGGAFTLPLDELKKREIDRYEGKEVSLGIRPEDIYVAGSAYIPGPVTEADFLLDVVEPMGNEVFVYARSLDQEVVARVAPQPLPEPGQGIRLAFDLRKLHFFDKESELAVGAEKSPAAAA